MLGKLSYRTRRVVELRYGFDGRDSCTLIEVAGTFKHFMPMRRCARGHAR
jgi:hypothetical protein